MEKQRHALPAGTWPFSSIAARQQGPDVPGASQTKPHRAKGRQTLCSWEQAPESCENLTQDRRHTAREWEVTPWGRGHAPWTQTVLCTLFCALGRKGTQNLVWGRGQNSKRGAGTQGQGQRSMATDQNIARALSVGIAKWEITSGPRAAQDKEPESTAELAASSRHRGKPGRRAEWERHMVPCKQGRRAQERQTNWEER